MAGSPGHTGEFLQKVLEPNRTGPSFKRLSVRNFGLGQERVRRFRPWVGLCASMSSKRPVSGGDDQDAQPPANCTDLRLITAAFDVILGRKGLLAIPADNALFGNRIRSRRQHLERETLQRELAERAA